LAISAALALVKVFLFFAGWFMFFQVFASSVEPVIGDLVTRPFSCFIGFDWPAA